jgi:acyl carrier protein
MEFNEILAEVTEIFKDILDNDKLVIDAKSSAADVEEWDSLSHIHIVVAIEKKYKIKFTTAELKNMKNVGNLVELIQSKLN